MKSDISTKELLIIHPKLIFSEFFSMKFGSCWVIIKSRLSSRSFHVVRARRNEKLFPPFSLFPLCVNLIFFPFSFYFLASYSTHLHASSLTWQAAVATFSLAIHVGKWNERLKFVLAVSLENVVNHAKLYAFLPTLSLPLVPQKFGWTSLSSITTRQFL